MKPLDKIILNLINSFVEGSGEIINDMLTGLTDKIFYAEKAFTQSLGSAAVMNFDAVYNLFFDFAISLIILKFLKKGFDIYIGWSDGDKDADPSHLVINFARAIITALSFRFLYDVMVDIVVDFMDKSLLSLLNLEQNESLIDAIMNLSGNVLFWGIAGLILVICYCILWIKFMVLGVEMLMLRIGFPLACIGLIDSDKGVFAPYMKKIFIVCLTAIVQIFLLRLSIILLGSGHLMWGIALCFGAMKTPKSLQEFMFSYGGGGMSAISGAISTAHHITSLKRVINKVK